MNDLAVLVFSIALADSLNPSTILPALYLATGPHAVRAVLGFAGGFFAATVLGGVAALMLGHAVAGYVPRPGAGPVHVGETVVGLAAIGGAGVLWHRRQSVESAFAGAEGRVTRAAPLAGATIAAVELPTALPYFAVIAALAASKQPLAADIALLVVFNVIFLAPVIAIALVRALAGEHAVDLMTRARRLVVERAGAIIAVLVLVLGIALVSIGLAGL